MLLFLFHYRKFIFDYYVREKERVCCEAEIFVYVEWRTINIYYIIRFSAEPSVTVHSADGSYFVDRQRRSLDWQLPVINSSNKAGSLECNIPGDDVNGFFPVMVSFISERLICDVDVSIFWKETALIFIYQLQT